MKTLKIFLPLLFITLIATLISCKKKCVIETDTINSGSIIKNVVFYPSSGFITGNMGGDYMINASHLHAGDLQVSINGSAKKDVNYNDYTVLCYPVSSKCNAAFDRTVTVDNTNQTVSYKIVVTQCGDCEEQRTTENYVLVPAIPLNYIPIYDVTFIEK
jgi:hypothetical protein